MEFGIMMDFGRLSKFILLIFLFFRYLISKISNILWWLSLIGFVWFFRKSLIFETGFTIGTIDGKR
jgi:hypothetical protein